MWKKDARMLTVKEVAERLGAATSSVRLWANSGRFVGAKLMGDAALRVTYWLIPETALENFQKQKPGPKPARNVGQGAPASKKRQASPPVRKKR
jgi:hypothetical protein